MMELRKTMDYKLLLRLCDHLTYLPVVWKYPEVPKRQQKQVREERDVLLNIGFMRFYLVVYHTVTLLDAKVVSSTMYHV